MAPEQIGKGEASVRSDIYSLGLGIAPPMPHAA